MDDSDNDREDVRMLVWENAGVEHCGGGKVELFKPVDDSDNDRKDCALIQNIRNLIERPNKSQHIFYYCNRCTYWSNSQIQYEKTQM